MNWFSNFLKPNASTELSQSQNREEKLVKKIELKPTFGRPLSDICENDKNTVISPFDDIKIVVRQINNFEDPDLLCEVFRTDVYEFLESIANKSKNMETMLNFLYDSIAECTMICNVNIIKDEVKIINQSNSKHVSKVFMGHNIILCIPLERPTYLWGVEEIIKSLIKRKGKQYPEYFLKNSVALINYNEIIKKPAIQILNELTEYSFLTNISLFLEQSKVIEIKADNDIHQKRRELYTLLLLKKVIHSMENKFLFKSNVSTRVAQIYNLQRCATLISANIGLLYYKNGNLNFSWMWELYYNCKLYEQKYYLNLLKSHKFIPLEENLENEFRRALTLIQEQPFKKEGKYLFIEINDKNVTENFQKYLNHKIFVLSTPTTKQLITAFSNESLLCVQSEELKWKDSTEPILFYQNKEYLLGLTIPLAPVKGKCYNEEIYFDYCSCNVNINQKGWLCIQCKILLKYVDENQAYCECGVSKTSTLQRKCFKCIPKLQICGQNYFSFNEMFYITRKNAAKPEELIKKQLDTVGRFAIKIQCDIDAAMHYDILLLEQIREQHLVSIMELITCIDIQQIQNEEIKNQKRATEMKLHVLSKKLTDNIENARIIISDTIEKAYKFAASIEGDAKYSKLTLEKLQTHIRAIEAEEKCINEVFSIFLNKPLERNIVDTKKQDELHKFYKHLEIPLKRIRTVNHNLIAIALERLKSKTNEYHNSLTVLIQKAEQILANPAVDPICYNDSKKRINEKIQEINKFIAEADSCKNSETVHPLNNLIKQAQRTAENLNAKHNLWIEFVKILDKANDEVDQARKLIKDFEANVNLRSLNAAKDQLKTHKSAKSAFSALEPALLKLQNLSDRLYPCEKPNTDLRFIETVWEQVNEDFETHITNLHSEINEESDIIDNIEKVVDKLNNLNSNVTTLERKSLIDISNKSLPLLRSEVKRLTKLNTDAQQKRRIIARLKLPSIKSINQKLNDLERIFQKRIQEVDSKNGSFPQYYTIPQKFATEEENLNVVGIDLGMCRCCVAVKRKNGMALVALDNSGDRQLPSYVGYDEEHVKCGQVVIDRLRNYATSTVFDSKRLIGRTVVAADKIWPFRLITSENKVVIKLKTPHGEVTQTATQVAAVLLKYMKEKTEEFQGKKLSKVVITVPAAFNSAQEEATREAAILAGWETVNLLPEPIAASFAYFINREIPNNSILLLFDLGGGTLDVCLFKIKNNQIQVISKNGDSKLGGRDFDSILTDYFANKMISEFEVSNTFIEDKKFKLLQECQKIKHNLTARNKDHLDVEDFDLSKNGLIVITQEEFKVLAEDLLNKIKNTIFSALYSSGYQSTQIDKVLQVGGGCRMPMIKKLLKETFPSAEHCCEEHPDEVVAIGAAYYAYNIFPNN